MTLASGMILFDTETVARSLFLPRDVPDADAYRKAVAEMAAKHEAEPVGFEAVSPALARIFCAVFATPAPATEPQKFAAERAFDFDGTEKRDRLRWCAVYDRSLADIKPEEIEEAYGSGFDVVTPCNGERATVEAVNAVLAKGKSLVTFGGRGFDVPLILLRSAALGIKPAAVLLASARQKPWERAAHIDLRDALSFGVNVRSATSLRAFCVGLGLPDPKAGDVVGEGVSEAIAVGKGAQVIAYCRRDVTVLPYLLPIAEAAGGI